MSANHIDHMNDLAGRVEGLGRVILHLIAQLEDGGVIDGPRLADELRDSIVVNERSDVLMCSARRTVNNAANALDEARRWRAFRREVERPTRHGQGPMAA